MRWHAMMFRTAPTPRHATVAGLALLLAGLSVAALSGRANARATVELDDAAVVAIFDLANLADIETGRVGMRRAQSQQVRDYARMLVDVHTAVRQQAQELAKKLGVKPELPEGDRMAEQHAQVMKRLEQVPAAEFDRAFLQHENAFHTAVLAAVKSTLLPAITNQELKKFVISLAPAFEAHRLAAEDLEKKLGHR